jgi:hypothetical protein
MVSMTKKRIKQVFNATSENIRKHKKPNVSGAMLDAGYSASSARALTITQTKTWQELLAGINDNELLNKLNEIATDSSDKRACLQAIDMSFKLKDRYPKAETKIIGIFNKITSLEE